MPSHGKYFDTEHHATTWNSNQEDEQYVHVKHVIYHPSKSTEVKMATAPQFQAPRHVTYCEILLNGESSETTMHDPVVKLWTVGLYCFGKCVS